jgi:hypothetical protein
MTTEELLKECNIWAQKVLEPDFGRNFIFDICVFYESQSDYDLKRWYVNILININAAPGEYKHSWWGDHPALKELSIQDKSLDVALTKMLEKLKSKTIKDIIE